MAKACAGCGEPLSLLQRLASDVCPQCEREEEQREKAAIRARREEREEEYRTATQRRYEAALRGEASDADLERLADAGYLVAGGRLVRCLVCQHDRFQKGHVLRDTRRSPLSYGHADRDLDTRVCHRCGYVMMFECG